MQTMTTDLVAIVKPEQDGLQQYLAQIRRKMNDTRSEMERVGYAIIALSIETELKRRG